MYTSACSKNQMKSIQTDFPEPKMMFAVCASPHTSTNEASVTHSFSLLYIQYHHIFLVIIQ